MAEPVRLRTPRAGWSDFAVRVKSASSNARPILRLPAFSRGPQVAATNVYQVLSTPVDFSAAAYVRQSGEPGKVRAVPRVLLPLPVRKDGTILLPATPEPLMIWVEMLTTPAATAGDTAGTCDLADGPNAPATASVRVTLSVADVTLPPERHLRIAAPLDWSALSNAPAFAGLTPRLLSRRDPANAAAIAGLDGYLLAAHDHRADLYVARLQPIVKWPIGAPPAVDWADFDSVTAPWFDGSAFADHRPTGYWPLPAPDALDRFDLAARAQYWALAADHFAKSGGATADHPVVLKSETGASPNEADRLILSAEARAILDAAPSVTALLPVRADRLPLADDANASLVSAAHGSRLLTRAVGSVQWGKSTGWPANTVPPSTYVNGSDPSAGDAVLHGTGDEEDVRSAAWLAYLRDAGLLTCGRPLPSTAGPDVPVPADQMPWFYPGHWYGTDGPLPTLQLKWLRQAEQDYEVLRLTTDGGDRPTALAVCRLIAKPVDAVAAGPAEEAAPSEVTLLGGSTDPHACASTRDLLMDRLAARQSHAGTGLTQLDLTTVRWFNAHQRPTAFATAVDWTWAESAPDLMGQTSDPTATGPGRWITARVRVDVYDPAEPVLDPGTADPARRATWSGNTLQWQTAGGWEPRPPTTYVPVIPACGVRPLTALARFNLEQATPAPAMTASGAGEPRPPIALSLVDAADRQTVDCPLVLPVATSDRLNRPVSLDGSLDEWVPTDAALLDRPLVRMSSRPAVHTGEAIPADHPSTVYTGWTDDDFYVAFRVGGATANGMRSTRNFVDYRDGRAWGEDLCEVTVQPVYADDAVGPTLHVVCKTGGEWVERQPADGAGGTGGAGGPGGAGGTGGWQPFEGAPPRYAATVDPTAGTWRGELCIPWRSLVSDRGRPSLLRFNFGQHVHATGESATWAGPVDQSRQRAMAGLLVLRDPQARANAGR